MKKRFLIASGAILLTAAGAFAGRISAKRGNAPALFVTGIGVSCTQVASSLSSSGTFTTGASGSQATISSSGTNRNTFSVYSTSECGPTHAVHFHI